MLSQLRFLSSFNLYSELNRRREPDSQVAEQAPKRLCVDKKTMEAAEILASLAHVQAAQPLQRPSLSRSNPLLIVLPVVVKKERSRRDAQKKPAPAAHRVKMKKTVHRTAKKSSISDIDRRRELIRKIVLANRNISDNKIKELLAKEGFNWCRMTINGDRQWLQLNSKKLLRQSIAS